MILHNFEYIRNVTSFEKVELSDSDVCFKILLLFRDRIELSNKYLFIAYILNKTNQREQNKKNA